MSHITTCPHCSTRLRVSDQVTDKTLICPHCLADVNSPQAGLPFRAADINTDVKRGLSLGSIILVVLIGLCALGITISFFQIRAGLGNNFELSFLFFFVALEVLFAIAIIRGLIRWGISGARSPSVGRIIGIVFLSLGTVMAALIFFLFTCVALLLGH